ncbi:hypothetical protein [Archangium sp.]|jgi:hypothetical protein|uniref:hypothetical protein n=1 Tax=Archangium sp. TaxID=1872627 RepID=UPI00389A7008
MPRKPKEENPTMHGDAKMSEETRKEVFGKSEKETAPEDAERQREFSGPSQEGRKDSAGSDKHS